MHDPMSLFRFEEHDIYLPMMTLEELDGHKKGMTEVARNVRQVSRDLDALAASLKSSSVEEMSKGLPLDQTGHREAGGKLFFQTNAVRHPAPSGAAARQGRQPDPGRGPGLKAQNRVARWCWCPRTSTCGSRPARWACRPRITATTRRWRTRTCCTPASRPCRRTSGSATARPGELAARRHHVLPDQRPAGADAAGQPAGLSGGARRRAAVCQVQEITARPRCCHAQGLRPPEAFGVGRERAQPRAELRAQCTDGPGDRLRHAAGHRRHRQDPAGAGCRPGADDGPAALPRDHHDPRHGQRRRGHRFPAGYRGGEDDAVDGRADRQPGSAGARRQHRRRVGSRGTNDLVRSKIKIKSLNFMRGRTFLNKYLILDEAQNLTPKQMKTLITRAGPGTKIVCLGNVEQIDTPYLTETTSGLTYAVDKFKGWPHGGHITLARGERSRLADFASEVL
ncbi:phoH-like protein [Ditylenchus destructor]|nr:phoH-like protein [Ditylenchus destructor]